MSEWTLMNPPRNRDGPAVAPGEKGSYSAPVEVETENALKEYLAKADSPLFLWLARTNAVTITLTNGATDGLLYKIRDTGRGTLSSKPDYEIFRQTSSDPNRYDGLFVGSIRFGKLGTEIKLPLTGKKVDDMEKFSAGGKSFKWEVTHSKRDTTVNRAKLSEEERKASPPSWIVVVDCFEGDKSGDDMSCSVKLFDALPNGRFEIWDQDIAKCAKSDGGPNGDWNALDEMIVLAYANMEKARRKTMKKGDPMSPGIAGLGMSGGAM